MAAVAVQAVVSRRERFRNSSGAFYGYISRRPLAQVPQKGYCSLIWAYSDVPALQLGWFLLLGRNRTTVMCDGTLPGARLHNSLICGSFERSVHCQLYIQDSMGVPHGYHVSCIRSIWS